MPIIDIEIVSEGRGRTTAAPVQMLADLIGQELNASPGRVWVRMRFLDRDNYAENHHALADDELPVFVTVLHAHPPEGAAWADEVARLTTAIAGCLNRDEARVHLEYAPAGVGRLAFGGRMAR